MRSPEADVAGNAPRVAALPPAIVLCPQVMRKRADFLRAARARRQPMPGFLLQARARARAHTQEPAGEAVRVGYTCSKKVGNAVTRNRAKRRLRAVAREVLCTEGRPGWDYVLIGRREATIARPFADLVADLHRALRRIHGQAG